ncbi:MAG: peptidylprolyl isomerase [Clostridia bacterium]|nr:peptidylprolyl isomerase [Clostridia bacterium]
MGKSQRNKKNSFVQKLLNAVVVVLVVATVLVMLWGVLNSQGVPHKLFNAVKVGDVGISVLEYNYYYETALQNFYNQYYSIIGYLGIDFNKSFKKQDSGWGEEGGTWDDYFKELTNGYVSEAVVLSEAAKAKGMTLNEENKAEIEKTLEENRKAAQSNQISLKQFYAMYYGSGMNEKVLRNLMERQYLAAQYVDELLESYQYSDQQIKDYYTEHADDMDYFNYMKYSFSIAAPQGNTDEEKKAWVDAVKAKAQEMCDKVTDRASFAALAVEYTEDETKKEDYEDEDACYKHLLKSSVGVNEEEWVVSADRKNGDKTVVSGESTVDVILFLGRERESYKTVGVRHILISANMTATTAEATAAKEEAKAKAEALLAKFKENGGTEEAFIALVADNTDDEASIEDGGLYEKFAKGYMTEAFDAWAYDETRKKGDSAVVESDLGYHVMYFSDYGEEYWKVQARAAKQNEDYGAHLKELQEAAPLKVAGFGMNLAGR